MFHVKREACLVPVFSRSPATARVDSAGHRSPLVAPLPCEYERPEVQVALGPVGPPYGLQELSGVVSVQSGPRGVTRKAANHAKSASRTRVDRPEPCGPDPRQVPAAPRPVMDAPASHPRAVTRVVRSCGRGPWVRALLAEERCFSSGSPRPSASSSRRRMTRTAVNVLVIEPMRYCPFPSGPQSDGRIRSAPCPRNASSGPGRRP
jgi:hypothetical protein